MNNTINSNNTTFYALFFTLGSVFLVLFLTKKVLCIACWCCGFKKIMDVKETIETNNERINFLENNLVVIEDRLNKLDKI